MVYLVKEGNRGDYGLAKRDNDVKARDRGLNWANLDLVIPIVMEVEDPVEFGLCGHH